MYIFKSNIYIYECKYAIRLIDDIVWTVVQAYIYVTRSGFAEDGLWTNSNAKWRSWGCVGANAEDSDVKFVSYKILQLNFGLANWSVCNG